MGGVGSGRTRGRPTVEATNSFVLTMRGLFDGLGWGCAGAGAVTFRRGRPGEMAVGVRVDTTDRAAPFVELAHEARDGSGWLITYRVSLATTRPSYGGIRWWFVCPSTGRRAFKLFLPNGGRRFLSRAGHGLGHQVTREDRLARCQRKAMRVLAGLGRPDACWLDRAPGRPGRMREATYARLYDGLARARREGEAILVAEAERRRGTTSRAR